MNHRLSGVSLWGAELPSANRQAMSASKPKPDAHRNWHDGIADPTGHVASMDCLAQGA